MKVLKIGNKDYVVKFTSKVIRELNAKGITLNTLFPTSDTRIKVSINTADSGIMTLVSGIRANDYIIAKFNYTNQDVCTNIDIFRVVFNM